MAFNSNNRLRPQVLQADRESLIAVQNLADYAPANSTYALARLEAAYAAMEAARAAEINAMNALAAARDAAADAERTFHNAILGAKDQVIAQYGPDSNEVQAVGLKKKSEHKRPSRRVSVPSGE